MKYQVLNAAVAALGVVLVGCETPEGTPYRAGTGALIGTGIGAASGALIAGGHHSAEGALIGGALGAITGGLIGQSMDQEERARLRAQAPQTYARVEQGQPLGLADVKAMAKAGLSDDVIISQIRNTHTVYRLGAGDIIDLRDCGASERVLEFMINTPNTVGSSTVPGPQAETVYVAQPPPPPVAEAVIVAPGPSYVWVGGEWAWHGRWVWAGGRWILPPRPYAVWVGGGWLHGSHGWRHSPGHWR